MSTTYSRYFSALADYNAGNPIDDRDIDGEFDAMTIALNRKVLCAASAPTSPIAGQTWVDTTNKVLKYYVNSEWVIIGPVHIGTSAPATPFEGMLWYDSTNNLLEAYNGSAWAVVMTYPSSTVQGDLVYLSAANTLARLAKDANATRYLANTGTSNSPAWGLINLTNGVSGTLAIANGGTEFEGGELLLSTTAKTASGWSEVSATYSNRFIRINATGALTGGADTHTHTFTLTNATMPAHAHTASYAAVGTGGSARFGGVTDAEQGNITTNTAGSGSQATTGSGDNVPAYVTCRMYQRA